MSDETLDDLLSDQEPEVQETETEETEQETSQEEESTATEEAETESEPESTGEKEDEPPSSDADNLTERERAWLAKSQDEKRKRQEAERELESYRSGKQDTNKSERKPPDPIDDPQGYASYVEHRISEAEWNTRFALSKRLVSRQHDDYEEVEQRFMELAKEDSSLLQKVAHHEFPAEFVYDHVQKHERFQKFDNFDDALKDAMDREWPAREQALTEKLRKEYEAKLNKAESIPPSGADGGSRGSDNTAVSNESLSDILGEKKK